MVQSRREDEKAISKPRINLMIVMIELDQIDTLNVDS